MELDTLLPVRLQRNSCGTAPGPPANALFAFAGVERLSAAAFTKKYCYQALQTKDEYTLARFLSAGTRNLGLCLTLEMIHRDGTATPERPAGR